MAMGHNVGRLVSINNIPVISPSSVAVTGKYFAGESQYTTQYYPCVAAIAGK